MRHTLTPPEPLLERESSTLQRALRGLHRALRTFLGSLPVEAQTPSGLARVLNVERTTCHRAVSAAMQPFQGLSLVAKLPGIDGLRILAAAAIKRSPVEPPVERAAATLTRAIDLYDAAIRQVSGSRSRLMSRISAHTDSQPSTGTLDASRLSASEPLRQRESLYNAAVDLTGRCSRTWLAVHIYEATADPDRIIQTRAHGLIGHQARMNAVPLTFHVFASDSADSDDPSLNRFVPLISNGDNNPRTGVLPQFSSQPLPIVESRQPNEFMVQFVELDIEQPEPASFDLVFGLTGRVAHPGRVPPYLEEVWALINFPVRYLLLDVFLHRDLARASLPGLDVHLWRPDFASTVGERWQTRFASGPKLQLLGADASQFDSEAHARHAELLRYLFDARGLRISDYVGFRCEVPYPIWRAGYRMSFDFGRDGSP